jgi:hypothetical protein
VFHTYVSTNQSIPGLGLPFGATMLTSGYTANAIGGLTLRQAVALGEANGRIYAAVAYPTFLATALTNAVAVQGSFQLGLYAGSMMYVGYTRLAD